MNLYCAPLLSKSQAVTNSSNYSMRVAIYATDTQTIMIPQIRFIGQHLCGIYMYVLFSQCIVMREFIGGFVYILTQFLLYLLSMIWSQNKCLYYNPGWIILKYLLLSEPPNLLMYFCKTELPPLQLHFQHLHWQPFSNS